MRLKIVKNCCFYATLFKLLRYIVRNMNIFTKTSLVILLSILAISCSKNKDENGNILEKKRIEPNLDKRLEAERDKGGGIFNSSRSQKTNTFEFSSSNVLWRAALNSTESLPLASIDYSGGLILTDWYSNDPNAKESIKIRIQFNSNELASTSVNVLAHKKICKSENCQIVQLSDDFTAKIKDAILEKARFLKTEDEKNKK